jgi:hypothetical protein
MIALANVSAKRFVLNNVAIANITAVTNLDVNVAVAAGSVAAGQVGFAVPTDASMTNGIPGIIPVRATSSSNLRLTFTNASAGAIDPADTFDFIVFLFENTGAVQQTV